MRKRLSSPFNTEQPENWFLAKNFKCIREDSTGYEIDEKPNLATQKGQEGQINCFFY